jgi:hypothetical protein
MIKINLFGEIFGIQGKWKGILNLLLNINHLIF